MLVLTADWVSIPIARRSEIFWCGLLRPARRILSLPRPAYRVSLPASQQISRPSGRASRRRAGQHRGPRARLMASPIIGIGARQIVSSGHVNLLAG
jgi:hypothetical protein